MEVFAGRGVACQSAIRNLQPSGARQTAEGSPKGEGASLSQSAIKTASHGVHGVHKGAGAGRLTGLLFRCFLPSCFLK